MRDISIRICNDGAIVNTIEDKLVHFELPVYFFSTGLNFSPDIWYSPFQSHLNLTIWQYIFCLIQKFHKP